MTLKLLTCANGLIATLGGTSGFLASITASLPDTNTIEALAKWPLTVVLGGVCVACVFFLCKQSREFGDKMLKMVEGERLATLQRSEANARVVKELAETNAKEIRELVDALIKKSEQ